MPSTEWIIEFTYLSNMPGKVIVYTESEVQPEIDYLIKDKEAIDIKITKHVYFSEKVDITKDYIK